MTYIVTRSNVGRRHGYSVTIDGDVIAKDLYGITTVLGQVVGKPELMYWSARECARGFQAAIREASRLEDLSPLMAPYFDGFDFAEATRDKAASRGSDLHGACEEIGRAWPLDDVSIAALLPTLGEKYRLKPEDMPLLDAYCHWLARNVKTILSVERMAACVHCGYGATLDLEAVLHDGAHHVLDIKTGKGVYPDMWLQLAAQDHALQQDSARSHTIGSQNRLGVLWLHENAYNGCELMPNLCDEIILTDAMMAVVKLWRWRQSLPEKTRNGK